MRRTRKRALASPNGPLLSIWNLSRRQGIKMTFQQPPVLFSQPPYAVSHTFQNGSLLALFHAPQLHCPPVQVPAQCEKRWDEEAGACWRDGAVYSVSANRPSCVDRIASMLSNRDHDPRGSSRPDGGLEVDSQGGQCVKESLRVTRQQ